MSADDVRLIAAVGAILLALTGMASGLWYRMGRLEGRIDSLAESQRVESEARRADTARLEGRLDTLAESQRADTARLEGRLDALAESQRANTAHIVSRIDRLFELRGTMPDSGNDD